MSNNAIAVKSKEEVLRSVMRNDDVLSQFVEAVGNRSQVGAYTTSVLVAVAMNEKLKTCTTASIIASAVRAASMRLTVDPASGHAYLVPFWSKEEKANVCTMILGYRGIYHIALRSGKYRMIELFDVCAGQTVERDRVTGLNTVSGSPQSDEVIGFNLYFELLAGFRKSFYMSLEECMKHGEKYSPTWKYDSSLWHTEPLKMAAKTVIRQGLLKWGYFDPADLSLMKTNDENTALESAELKKVVEIAEQEAEKPQLPKHTAAENVRALGFDPSVQKSPDPTTHNTSGVDQAPAAPQEEAVTDEWTIRIKRAQEDSAKADIEAARKEFGEIYANTEQKVAVTEDMFKSVLSSLGTYAGENRNPLTVAYTLLPNGVAPGLTPRVVAALVKYLQPSCPAVLGGRWVVNYKIEPVVLRILDLDAGDSLPEEE